MILAVHNKLFETFSSFAHDFSCACVKFIRNVWLRVERMTTVLSKANCKSEGLRKTERASGLEQRDLRLMLAPLFSLHSTLLSY